MRSVWCIYCCCCCSADLYENEAVESLLDFWPWWEVAYKKAKSGAATEDVGMLIIIIINIFILPTGCEFKT